MGVFRRKVRVRGTRIYFATDVHGSEDCFRKLLNARRFYDVQVLVLGGDMIGKGLVPIAKRASGYSAEWRGESFTDVGRDGLEELQTHIRRAGDYYLVGSPEDLAALNDPDTLDRAFRRAARQSVEQWVTLAEERLRGTGVKCYMAPGNDDFLDIDGALQAGEAVVFAENNVLDIDGTHEMLTTGYSNPTPWKTERELEEPAMRERLDAMACRIGDMSNAVAVIHPPPIGSGLDLAPKIDQNLRVQSTGGAVLMEPVGSTAVREFIECSQPLIGLHGHVHEGKGTCQIGRTLCVNPGSEYSAGVLTGSLIELGDEQILSHQFVLG